MTLTARWGEQIDVRHITEGGDEGELNAEQVAGYVAKYATRGCLKSPYDPRLSDRPRPGSRP